MNFGKLIKDTDKDKPISIPIGKFSIKNKGSVVKISEFYINFYNKLIENFGLECKETRYVHNDKGGDLKPVQFDWVAYKKVDDFARIRFNFIANAFFVKGDNVMGIFIISYTLELDHKEEKKWRNSGLLKLLLPYYLRFIYNKQILQWLDYFGGELSSIKNELRTLMNMNIFD